MHIRRVRLRRAPRTGATARVREERASGEEAIRSREQSEAEATPSRMNRLKTYRL